MARGKTPSYRPPCRMGKAALPARLFSAPQSPQSLHLPDGSPPEKAIDFGSAIILYKRWNGVASASSLRERLLGCVLFHMEPVEMRTSFRGFNRSAFTLV